MFRALALRQSDYNYEQLQLPITLTKGQRLKHQLFYSLQWLIYVFNPVVNTKLPAFIMLYGHAGVLKGFLSFSGYRLYFK